MKDFNELEKLEKLSKSMSEDESSVQKPKSKLPFIIIGAVVLLAIIVGVVLINNNKVKQEESKPDTIYENGADSESEEVDTTYEDSTESEEEAREEDLREVNIVLADNDKFKVTILSYEDSEGVFAVKIENKSDEIMSSGQEGDGVLLDGSKHCISETSGSHSFAYVWDIPAKSDVTLFSTFRKNADDGWDTKIRLSENHTFEFTMTAWEENFNWEEKYNVKLTPDMFGY